MANPSVERIYIYGSWLSISRLRTDVTAFLQASGFDMECEIDSSELLEQKGYCLHWQGEGVCNTGDTFLTELSDVKGDVVDMEAYAQALVCRAKNTPFIAVKYVTDIIGQNSVKHWEDKLADARKGLGEFLEALGGVV